MIMQSCECSKMSQSGTSIHQAMTNQCYECSSSSTIIAANNKHRSHKKSPSQQTKRIMTKKILRLLRAENNRVSAEQGNLGLVAKKVERHLYQNSKSKVEYVNDTTLKERVHMALSKIEIQTEQEERISGTELDLHSQQQQLVQLYHASKCCQNCEDKEECMETKKLWQHLAICKDSDCAVENCFTSRKLLSHHLLCKNSSCSLCRPVRSVGTIN